MYLLYCDETNLEHRKGDFFVYGGLAIASEVAIPLSAEVDSLRKKYSVPPNFSLKFNLGPSHLSHSDFINLKQALVECAISHSVVFITSLILHDIAKSPDDARRNEINRVCYHFDCFLNRKESSGLVLIDRFNDGQVDAHLVEKFSVGITGLPFTPVRRLSCNDCQLAASNTVRPQP